MNFHREEIWGMRNMSDLIFIYESTLFSSRACVYKNGSVRQVSVAESTEASSKAEHPRASKRAEGISAQERSNSRTWLIFGLTNDTEPYRFFVSTHRLFSSRGRSNSGCYRERSRECLNLYWILIAFSTSSNIASTPEWERDWRPLKWTADMAKTYRHSLVVQSTRRGGVVRVLKARSNCRLIIFERDEDTAMPFSTVQTFRHS